MILGTTMNKKYIFHVAFWMSAIIYLVFSPDLYYHFFVTEGKKTSYPYDAYALLSETSEFRANIDYLNLYDEKGTYELEGWIFLTGELTPTVNYDQTLVLISSKKLLGFEVENYVRKDVTNFYQARGWNRNLDDTGFRSKISIYGIRPGNYRILMFFKLDDGSTVYVDTHRCITRTPNTLILREREAICE